MSQDKDMHGLKLALKKDVKENLKVYLFTIPFSTLMAYVVLSRFLETTISLFWLPSWITAAYIIELIKVFRKYYKNTPESGIALDATTSHSTYIKGTITVLSEDGHYILGSVTAQEYEEAKKTAQTEFMTQISQLVNKVYVIFRVLYSVIRLVPIVYFWVFVAAYYLQPSPRAIASFSDIFHPEIIAIISVIILVVINYRGLAWE